MEFVDEEKFNLVHNRWIYLDFFILQVCLIWQWLSILTKIYILIFNFNRLMNGSISSSDFSENEETCNFHNPSE